MLHLLLANIIPYFHKECAIVNEEVRYLERNGDTMARDGTDLCQIGAREHVLGTLARRLLKGVC